MTNTQQKYIYIMVFISGLASLGIEMAASRLVGNVFGSSNLVWASIIGLILIYLTVGYFIGGRWADKHPEPSVFYRILFWAGMSTAVIPLIAQPVLRLAANAFDRLQLGVLAGSFISVMILLLVPMILLGTASPFAIRLRMSTAEKSGQVAGQIYAISTIGSFIGTFLPSLILIPLIGTYRTFMLFGALLILAAIVGLVLTLGLKKNFLYIGIFVVVIVLLFIGPIGNIKQSTGQVYEAESEYNYIQVLQEDGYSMLRLNDGQGIHSIYHPTQKNFYGPWEQFLVGPFFNESPVSTDRVESIAIVGLAAGTTARAATEIFGDIPIDGYEIDGKIVDVARKYFDMNERNLNVHVQDGRWGLDQSGKTYSLIAIDAYRPPYIPPHLTTVEFFRIVKAHLEDDGVVVINVGRAPNDRRLINSLASTMKEVFSSIYVMDIPDTFNSMIFATVLPTESGNLLRNFQTLSKDGITSPVLLDTMQLTLANLQPAPPAAQVYTDDLAPIEWVTNNMVLNYILTEDVSTLGEPQ